MRPCRPPREGDPAGRDPREMTQDELRAAGHEPMRPLRALRARCLDCCAGQANEVAACPVVECPSWSFRMGTNPWRKPASEARRASARRTMERINARRTGGGAGRAASPPEDGTAPRLARGSEIGLTSSTRLVDRASDTEQQRKDECSDAAGEVLHGRSTRRRLSRDHGSGRDLGTKGGLMSGFGIRGESPMSCPVLLRPWRVWPDHGEASGSKEPGTSGTIEAHGALSRALSTAGEWRAH